ncbi:MAG TPA: dTDP-4-dehydrorhamnose 3,5-epimerase [Chloroflexia bacterium]|nr:dTDP-4-dehydrorhamnose 3,5-epimerase [Chloroflexia bacterium]
MRFIELELKGAYILEVEPFSDERGFFARTFCVREFEQHNLNATVVQCNVSFNYKKGTLRGMHYQTTPATEEKLVRCIHGSIYDVIIDLRPGSPTYGKYAGVELSADNRRSLYIPAMFAHGFQTLEDNTEVFYQMSEFFAPEYASGFRYDDPAFGIKWPLPVNVIAQKDLNWPDFEATL